MLEIDKPARLVLRNRVRLERPDLSGEPFHERLLETVPRKFLLAHRGTLVDTDDNHDTCVFKISRTVGAPKHRDVRANPARNTYEALATRDDDARRRS